MPDRQVPALLEQCGWLLAHPNCTNGELGDALAMAEGTRRSNISRLRHWLGPDGHGGLLLPAGRSGRLRLAREVCGDWQLVHGLLSDPTLVNLIAAVRMIRGSMLADVPRGSWRWAEQIVAETKAMLLDSVVALVRISERRGDVSLARWSLTQGWLLDRRSPVLAELAETLPRIQDVELGVCAGCHYRTAPVEPEGRPRVRVGEEFVAAGRVFRVAA